MLSLPKLIVIVLLPFAVIGYCLPSLGFVVECGPTSAKYVLWLVVLYTHCCGLVAKLGDPEMVITFPATLETAPTNSGIRTKGTETKVSELAGQAMVVKPTGSVATVWAGREEARHKVTKSAARREVNGRIGTDSKATKVEWDGASSKLRFFIVFLIILVDWLARQPGRFHSRLS
jgi:hypothetical protein